jgi:hypothetical protein
VIRVGLAPFTLFSLSRRNQSLTPGGDVTAPPRSSAKPFLPASTMNVRGRPPLSAPRRRLLLEEEAVATETHRALLLLPRRAARCPEAALRPEEEEEAAKGRATTPRDAATTVLKHAMWRPTALVAITLDVCACGID